MKKTFTIIIAAVSLLTGLNASAQNTDTVNTSRWFKKEFAGAVLVQVTYRKTNLNQLNSVLNANGIPSLGNNNIWISAVMDKVYKNNIFEHGLGFTPITSAEANGIKARFNQYQAFLRYGYNISGNSNYRLFPFAGINLNAAVLNIRDKKRIESTPDFSNQILNSTSSKTLYQGNLGIDLGAGLDYLIKIKSKQVDNVLIERSFPIGLRAGYYINAHQGDWKIDDFELQNGPNKKNSTFFVTLNIGLGYKITKTR